MQNETTTQPAQEKIPKVMGSYRLPQDLVAEVKRIAGQLNVSEAWVVEIYLGTSLGLRKFPELKPPAFQN
jgi:hypothetical protein